MDITSVYNTAILASMKSSNDDYIANKTMYKELNTVRLKVLGQNNLGASGTYATHQYTSVANKDYFGTFLQKLSVMFPDSFIYYTPNSNPSIASPILTETSVAFNSSAYSASSTVITNTIFISQSALIIPTAFTDATIGTPINATYAPINNRKCWEIIGNTTITFGQYSGLINFVAVGGGQNSDSSDYSGGNGGGVVYGSFNIEPNYTLTIMIGTSDMPTKIIGTDINIIANGGTVNGGSATGSKIVSSTIKNGGLGGNYVLLKSNEGFDGPSIDALGIYVAGGGSTNAYYTPSGQFSYYVLSRGGAGGGGGFESYINKPNGSTNTGGGAAGATIVTTNFGGSGVVYLYI
jgi:hypothetical protein